MDKIKNIIVTGGAGFIGSHLVDALVKEKHNVIIIDNLVNGSLENINEALTNKNVSFIDADILDASRMNDLFKDIDIVYHLACLGVRHSLHSPFENHRVNAEGSLNVLEASRKNNVKKFFYISTSEIYGDVKHFPIEENCLPLPKTVYGSSKLAGENYAYSYNKCYGLDVTILRIFNNYGPRAHYEGDAGEVIPRSIVKILNNEAPVIFGDGSVTRDFFYVKDTAEVLCKMLDQANISGEIINVGTGEEVSMKLLLESLIELMGKKELINIEYLDDRPADVPRLWVNNSKFHKLTGFKPNFTFEQGLNETIEFYQKLNQNKNLLKDVKLLNWESE